MTDLQKAKAREEAAKAEARTAELVTKLIAAKDAEAAAEKAINEAKDEPTRKGAKEALELAQQVTKGAGKALVDHKNEVEAQSEVNLVCAGGGAKGYFGNLWAAIF